MTGDILQAAAAAPSAAMFRPAAPMGYLHTFGPRADPATSLTWGLLFISIGVVVIISLLVVAGVVARRARVVDGRLPTVSEPRGGEAWIWIGLIPTVAALVISLVWTVAVLARINAPARKPAFTLQVTGRQWWWEVGYAFERPDEDFVTANEIHIPVGQPVLVEVTSGDVIHSFWAPALTGKTDAIPGRTNLAWIEADRPGIYRGQCTEYCGAEHALMALYVVAQTPSAFAEWRRRQAPDAAAPSTAAASAGEQVFEAHCGACHAVRGTPAGGVEGPDLTHLAGRATLASGTLPNTPGSLAGWISNPQALKPGAKMPITDLDGAQLGAVTAYLEGLK